MSKRSSRINPRKLVETPTFTLHRLVQQHMQESGELDYGKAYAFVVSQPDNRELWDECMRWPLRLSGHE